MGEPRCSAVEGLDVSVAQKRLLYNGKTLVRWPAKDVREAVMVVYLSRLDEDLIGVKRRQYGVYRSKVSPPEYPVEVEFISLAAL